MPTIYNREIEESFGNEHYMNDELSNKNCQANEKHESKIFLKDLNQTNIPTNSIKTQFF